MKLVNLLLIVLLLPFRFDFSIDSLSIHSASLESTATVIVTNATDVVNGDISGIAALIANPGPDGISFREALGASNYTLGLKTIEFAPNLKGATIILGSAGTEWVMLLTSGQLTINGDIDGDGKPDITLDGSLGVNNSMGSGLSIWSDYNIIKGLSLVGFYSAVQISPLVPEPLQKVIVGNQIVDNLISSTILGSFGIMVGSGGHLSPAEAYKASDLLFQDILIAGNTISVKSIGIGVIAGSGGSSRNHASNITIMNNHITDGSGVGIGAGDTASDYFGVPGPIYYSDNNLVDHVAIIDNIIEDGYISIGAANLGNRYNQVQHVQIDNNTIMRPGTGIFLIASGNGGKERSTSYNAMSDIEVDHNTIVDALSFGILVGVGDTVDFSPDNPIAAGIENSQISKLHITNNSIENYHEAGIRIWGGCGVQGSLYASNNLLDQLAITGNTIAHHNPPGGWERAVGIELLAGESFGGPAQANTMQGVIISSNTVSGNDFGISLIGGRGTGVQGNRIVMAEMQLNDLAGNTEFMQIIDNTQGAVDNFVDWPNKIYLPLVEQE